MAAAAAVVSSAGVVGAEFEEGIAVAATPGLGLGPRAATVGDAGLEEQEAETLRRGRRWATGLCSAAAAVAVLAQLPSHIRWLLRYTLSKSPLICVVYFQKWIPPSAQLSCGICVESLALWKCRMIMCQ